jgi:phosphate transport system substrate-binding protein
VERNALTRRTVLAAALALALPLRFAQRARAAVTLTIAGSTTLEPLLRAAAAAYQVDNADVSIAVTGGGSAAAIARLGSGSLDMAASDYETTADDLFAHRIAVVGFAFAVNPAAGVASLTREQLRGVLSGAVVNYRAVGGNDVPVVVIERPESSGIRALVAARIMRGAPFARGTTVEDGTTGVVSDIRDAEGGIGYSTFGGVRDAGLTALAIDGIAPTDENVTNASYPLWAYEYIVTNGPATVDESRFLAYLETNRTLLREYGYIAVQDIERIPAGE